MLNVIWINQIMLGILEAEHKYCPTQEILENTHYQDQCPVLSILYIKNSIYS